MQFKKIVVTLILCSGFSVSLAQDYWHIVDRKHFQNGTVSIDSFMYEDNHYLVVKSDLNRVNGSWQIKEAGHYGSDLYMLYTSGKLILEYPKGTLRLAGKVINQLMVGEWVVYNEDGSIQRKYNFDTEKDEIVSPDYYVYTYPDGSTKAKGKKIDSYDFEALANVKLFDDSITYNFSKLIDGIFHFTRTGISFFYKEDGFKYAEAEFSPVTNSYEGRVKLFKRDGSYDSFQYSSNGLIISLIGYDTDATLNAYFLHKDPNSPDLEGYIVHSNSTSFGKLGVIKSANNFGIRKYFTAGPYGELTYFKKGIWNYMGSNDNLVKRKKFENGIAKKVVTYYPNGEIKRIESYDNEGKITKDEYIFNSGKTNKVYMRKLNGDWILYKAFDLEGKKTLYEGNGYVQEYYDNNTIKDKIYYKDGLMWKAVKTYSIYGEKLKKGTLKKGNGTRLIYTPEGKLIRELTYVNGKMEDIKNF